MHYLDYAATAPVLEQARDAMVACLDETWGNPSSVYGPGRSARAVIDSARERVAAAINSTPEEIVFTGGGTEAGNLAMKGAAWMVRDRRRHVLLPKLEHHAVLDAAEWLGANGFEVEHIPVDSTGTVDASDVADRLRDDTALVAVMLVNNEIGTVEPVAQIAEVCRARGVLTYTDAVQALGKIAVDVAQLGVDMAGFSAHKVGGPKGTGALFVRRGVRIQPTQHGGGQERGRRSGTENVAGIAGFAAAVDVVMGELETEPRRWVQLRDRLEAGLLAAIADIRVNGHPLNRVPHNLNVSVKGVTGEDVLMMLDMAGICASTGSACQSGSAEPSYVLAACGVPRQWAEGTLRFTVGRMTTDADVDAVLSQLPPMIERLRSFAKSR